MLLRRFGPLAIAAAAACAPGVSKTPGPAEVDYAVFDPQNQQLPQPNDLLLAQDLTQPPFTLLPAAQVDLLTEFQKAGGFPNDQEVPITIDFTATTVNASGVTSQQGPDLDTTSINASTLTVLGVNGTSGVSVATLDPVQPTDYVKFGDHGTLTLHNKGRQRWSTGTHYVVGVRGGPNGVKLTNGNTINPQPTTFLLIQDKNLNLPENQALLRLQLGSRGATAAAAAQLEQIRLSYLQPFAAIDAAAFPHSELALIQTFQIAPLLSAHVETDPSAGIFPLPSNFLLDPTNGGKTVANIPAFGPAAAGLATLDGFSTTAMLIAQTSDSIPIDASTVTSGVSPGGTSVDTTKASVAIYDLTNPAAPVIVDPKTYEAEPAGIAQSATGGGCAPSTAAQGTCFSKLVGLQPAAPAVSLGAGIFNTRPLKEATLYGVVITDRVKDLNGQPLSKSTIGKLLLFDHPLANITATGATSNLQGVADATAAGVEAMRLQLQGVFGKIPTDLGLTKAHVAMAYTFRTQSITGAALQLGGLPYAKNTDATDKFPGSAICTGTPAFAPPPAQCTIETAASAFSRFGVDETVVPSANILRVVEVPIVTFNALDPATGAFRPAAGGVPFASCFADPTKQPCIEFARATIVVPNPASVTTACDAAHSGAGYAGLNCAPVVVFRHGINGGRADMLTVADSFAAKGMVVVAIDAPKHGDRALCQTDADCANVGVTPKCNHDAAQVNQGDPAGFGPGKCAVPAGLPATGFVYRTVRCPSGSVSPNCTGFNSAAGGGIPKASGNFVISANFFRTRDTFRQDIIDQSMLVRVLAPLPSPAAGTNATFELLKTFGIAADPLHVYFVGQSLGSINGVLDVATNPRISKAVLNVGGGTITDLFLNSPSFKTQVDGLLASLGVKRGTAQFLQLNSLVKWILDPADPINFAKNLIQAPLPSFLPAPNPNPQAPKKVLGQRAQCDQTVPDPFNLELYNNIGLSPGVPGAATTVFTLDATKVSPADCPPPPAPVPAYAVHHGFITDWATYPVGTPGALTQRAQNDAANFLASDVTPSPLETPVFP